MLQVGNDREGVEILGAAAEGLQPRPVRRELLVCVRKLVCGGLSVLHKISDNVEVIVYDASVFPGARKATNIVLCAAGGWPRPLSPCQPSYICIRMLAEEVIDFT